MNSLRRAGGIVRRRWVLSAMVIVALILGVSSYGAWYALWRPWTIRDLLEADALQPGTSRELEGTITGVYRLNTSRGPIVGIELDGNKTCPAGAAFGDPTRTYRIGDRYRTVMHFQDYTFNGQPGVWAPEVFCTFYGITAEVMRVIDTVSSLLGFKLRVADPAGDGWTALEVVSANRTVTPQNLSASLRAGEAPVKAGRPFRPDSAARWEELSAVEYVNVVSHYSTHPVVDRMNALSEAASQQGMMRYVDGQQNGLLDVGDRIEIRLNATGGIGQYRTFLLELFDPNTPQTPWAMKYILHGPEGPIDWNVA